MRIEILLRFLRRGFSGAVVFRWMFEFKPESRPEVLNVLYTEKKFIDMLREEVVEKLKQAVTRVLL
jgi:hypothetical protein